MEHFLTFNGKSSRDFGVWISGGGTFNAPVRDVEFITIPGRNGDLTVDGGRFSNISVTYPAFISRGFQPNVDGFRAWLCAAVGYKRLEDTYHPEEYRLAVYRNGLKVTPTARNLSGSFDLTFECKPQRFLKSGEQVRNYSRAGVLRNPTDYPARPLIRAYGVGTLTVGGVSVEITAANVYTVLDCDTEEAFKGADNCNQNIVLIDGEFPSLHSGNNSVSFDGISKVEIVPRWWTI